MKEETSESNGVIWVLTVKTKIAESNRPSLTFPASIVDLYDPPSRKVVGPLILAIDLYR